MLKDYQERIIELLGQLELDMSNLYKLFADKFPKHKDLWLMMSQQEIVHAEHVKKLYSFAQGNKIIFDEKMTKTYTVKKVLEVIKDVHTKAETNKLTLLNALSMSRDLEESLIEKKFFDYFIETDPETKILINRIKEDTLEHHSKLKSAWEEERKR
ncbi:MAG: hypothetical protein ABFD82_11290 [Syntrophaceae bacterium]